MKITQLIGKPLPLKITWNFYAITKTISPTKKIILEEIISYQRNNHIYKYLNTCIHVFMYDFLKIVEPSLLVQLEDFT